MQKVIILKDFPKKSVGHLMNEHPNFDLHLIKGTSQSAVDCSTTKTDTSHPFFPTGA